MKAKAKDVMKHYGICRETLGNWVKKGLIKFEKTPSGRYIYYIEDKNYSINEKM